MTKLAVHGLKWTPGEVTLLGVGLAAWSTLKSGNCDTSKATCTCEARGHCLPSGKGRVREEICEGSCEAGCLAQHTGPTSIPVILAFTLRAGSPRRQSTRRNPLSPTRCPPACQAQLGSGMHATLALPMAVTPNYDRDPSPGPSPIALQLACAGC